jgi:hypothetical protein
MKWRQECQARRDVRRLCPVNTDPNPATHFTEMVRACGHATACATMMK